MKGFRDRNPYAVGLVSVLVIGFAVAMAFLIGVLHLFEKNYTVRAEFSDASGARVGDDVRVAGIKSGRISKVTADRTRGLVLIDLDVHKGVNLGHDTSAEIALETLLGKKFIRLSGPVIKPYLADSPRARRVIPHDRTKTPFDVFEIARISTRSVEATDTDKLNKFITQLADITQDKQTQLRQLLDGISSVSNAVNQRDAQLRDLLDRLDAVSNTLEQKDQTLVGLIDQSQGVLRLVQERRSDIAGSLQAGNQLATELTRVVDVHKSQLDAILNVLHPTLDVIDKEQGKIDQGLSWVGSGSIGLSKAASHGPWQDVYVRSVGPDVLSILCGILGGTQPCV